jgi:hypothetical protein
MSNREECAWCEKLDGGGLTPSPAALGLIAPIRAPGAAG